MSERFSEAVHSWYANFDLDVDLAAKLLGTRAPTQPRTSEKPALKGGHSVGMQKGKDAHSERDSPAPKKGAV
jgi:hypothetical protein